MTDDFDEIIRVGVAAFSEEESDSDSNGCKNNNWYCVKYYSVNGLCHDIRSYGNGNNLVSKSYERWIAKDKRNDKGIKVHYESV